MLFNLTLEQSHFNLSTIAVHTFIPLISDLDSIHSHMHTIIVLSLLNINDAITDDDDFCGGKRKIDRKELFRQRKYEKPHFILFYDAFAIYLLISHTHTQQCERKGIIKIKRKRQHM
jgi:hypothetical protein